MGATDRTASRHERLGRALTVLGTLVALAGIVRAALLHWRPAETWDPRDPWLDGALMLAGVATVVAGFVLHRRGVAAGRSTPATFLTAAEERRVLDAIRAFEARTSGEIRVHLAGGTRADVLAEARETFERIGMTATAQKNGVLFFVAVAARRFAVLGDEGIHAKVEDAFWQRLAHDVEARFRTGDVAGALVHGIETAGAALVEHFPHQAGDRNELPDDISRSS